MVTVDSLYSVLRTSTQPYYGQEDEDGVDIRGDEHPISPVHVGWTIFLSVFDFLFVLCSP